MVRLMLTLTPVVCVCGGIVVSEVLTIYLDSRKPVWLGGEDSSNNKSEVSSKQKEKSNIPTEQPTTGIIPE